MVNKSGEVRVQAFRRAFPFFDVLSDVIVFVVPFFMPPTGALTPVDVTTTLFISVDKVQQPLVPNFTVPSDERALFTSLVPELRKPLSFSATCDGATLELPKFAILYIIAASLPLFTIVKVVLSAG